MLCKKNLTFAPDSLLFYNLPIAMTSTQLILLILGLLLAFTIVRRIISTAFKLVIWAIILGAVYFLVTGRSVVEEFSPDMKKFFANKTINQLMADNCNTADEDKTIKCRCLVQPVYQDMVERLGKEGVIGLENSKIRMEGEMAKSLYNQTDDIKQCFKQVKDEKMSFIDRILCIFKQKES